jgi:hypothetical protein
MGQHEYSPADNFCFSATIQSSIFFRTAESWHFSWAFCSLSISALISARSPGEGMARECTPPYKQVKPGLALWRGLEIVTTRAYNDRLCCPRLCPRTFAGNVASPPLQKTPKRMNTDSLLTGLAPSQRLRQSPLSGLSRTPSQADSDTSVFRLPTRESEERRVIR